MTLQGHLRRIGAGARTREFRHDLRKCKLGFLNVRTLQMRRVVVQGAIVHVLALSEVQLPDQGVTTYDEGFVLIAAGVGSQGGTALLLSPAAASAWRAAGC